MSSSPASSPSSSPQTIRRSVRHQDNGSAGTVLPLAHLVGAVVDRSGSMASMGNAPPEQMHSQMIQLKDEAEKTGVSTFMTVVTFDDKPEVFMDNVRLDGNDSLPSYSDFQSALHPRGTTRFYDTVYEGIVDLEARRDTYTSSLSNMVKMLNPKIVCSLLVLTDGADNSSTDHNQSTVSARMTKARTNGINAIFLAANIDAGSTGAALGFAKQATVQMGATYAGASQCMRAVSAGLRQASSGATDVDYSQMASQSPDLSNNSADDVSLRATAAPPMPPMPILRRY